MIFKEIIEELKKDGIQINIIVYGTFLYGPLILINPHYPKTKATFPCGHLRLNDNTYTYYNNKNKKTYRWCKMCRAFRSKKSYHNKNPYSPYTNRIKKVSVVSDID